MRINRYWMPFLALFFFLGTVFTAKAAGYWQTSGRQMLDADEHMTSADLRGWMTLDLISEELDIPLADLYLLLDLPADTPSTTVLKDLEALLEVSEVRTRVADYLGESSDVPSVEGQLTPTPEPIPTLTVTLLPPVVTTPSPELTHEPRPASGTGSGEGAGLGPTPLPPGEILPGAEIKGRMTLQEVSDQCAVPLDWLYDQLGIPADLPPSTALRQVHEAVPDFEVSVLRELVTSYQLDQ